MPVLELHYDHRMINKSGRVIAFKANVPRDVPDVCVDDCLAIGARPIDDKVVKSVPAKPKNKPLISGNDRTEAVKKALAVIKEENKSENFAGTGRPKVAVVIKMVGFRVDVEEVTKLWDDLNDTTPVAETAEES